MAPEQSLILFKMRAVVFTTCMLVSVSAAVSSIHGDGVILGCILYKLERIPIINSRERGIQSNRKMGKDQQIKIPMT